MKNGKKWLSISRKTKEITMYQISKNSVIKDNLKDLNLDDFLVYSFCIIDDMYQELKHFAYRSGPDCIFSDSETICLNLVGQMVSDSESGWHSFVKKNYLHLFPRLSERSRYHRKCKDLQQITELIRHNFIVNMDYHLQKGHIIDSMPIPVCVYARASRNMRFVYDTGINNADLYGHCASKKEDIYGFKLHLMVTTTGVPVHYVLAPAAFHDVVVAPDLLETYQKNIITLGDKGYFGIQKRLNNPEQHQVIIQARDNQKKQNTKTEKKLLGLFRKTIETTNSLLAGQFNIQFTRAKSVRGLTSRIIAKITAITFAIYLNYVAKMPLLKIKDFIF